MYDDGDTHTYQMVSTNSNVRISICDEDGDTLDMYRSILDQVGGAGILVLRVEEELPELSTSTGAVDSSFDAEIFAAVRAFEAIEQLQIPSRQHVRWFTDSMSSLDALAGQPRMYGEMTRKLWDAMGKLMDDMINIEVIWIPSHCGLPGNEKADELAHRSITEPSLVAHQNIPLTLEVARSIIKPLQQEPPQS